MPEQPRGPKVYLDKTRTRIVPAGSPEAAVMVHEKDARALGIDVTPAAEPEDEKAQEPAANKARTKAEDK